MSWSFGYLFFAESLEHMAEFCLVTRPLALVTLNRSSMVAIVLNVASFTTEEAARITWGSWSLSAVFLVSSMFYFSPVVLFHRCLLRCCLSFVCVFTRTFSWILDLKIQAFSNFICGISCQVDAICKKISVIYASVLQSDLLTMLCIICGYPMQNWIWDIWSHNHGPGDIGSMLRE